MRKIDQMIANIRPLDEGAMEEARRRQDNLTKPQGSLGQLEVLSIQIAGIKMHARPTLHHKVIFTLAGDHGVTQEGISAYPSEVTPQMVYNFLRGGAGINVLARYAGARVVVADFGVASILDTHPDLKDKKIAMGTRNMTEGPAMSREEAIRSIEAGIELVEEELPKGIDIIGTGDMGIGNTTPSSAIASVITGADVAIVTGKGTGLDEAGWRRKVEVIEKAIRVNQPNPKDGIDVLSKVGGYEIGGIAGLILAGARYQIPVVIDGFISGAAALIAHSLSPEVKPYLIASHQSAEPGHKKVLEYLGLKPLFNLDLRLGEGTGSAIGIFLVEASLKILNEMATFTEAGVSEKIENT
ncbi:MAG: nicotinate-nucleotide--dimethylbenzimidazole phosphoribosyltransferase [Deltaproteobacteria bacterium]|nr:nicotinate-nucleotide--dimethylbenzimidazole phosphoribosyltransferase [Deltaproteobacteria bacterium]MBM4322386.1 nicotinate-nucleotide--dimethylbenzimidazole phosphoribosyltransferase [Deltaproteobacteria bacterium]